MWNGAHSIFFFKGRLSFYDVEGKKGGSAAAPSCLVSYSEENSIALTRAIYDKTLEGVYIKLS